MNSTLLSFLPAEVPEMLRKAGETLFNGQECKIHSSPILHRIH